MKPLRKVVKVERRWRDDFPYSAWILFDCGHWSNFGFPEPKFTQYRCCECDEE